jgi:hypothetical protein
LSPDLHHGGLKAVLFRNVAGVIATVKCARLLRKYHSPAPEDGKISSIASQNSALRHSFRDIWPISGAEPKCLLPARGNMNRMGIDRRPIGQL